MSDQKYISRGRTGREGVSLKSFGGLAAIVGLLWALIAFFSSEGFSPLILPLLILAVGGLLFWVGLSMGRHAAGAQS
jgi:hypothetical protein